MLLLQKYELKRHKAVHENITFTCPYCSKVVKRKPSMIKHLRVLHLDMEVDWNRTNFVETLKKFVTIDLEDRSPSSPPSTASPTSRDSTITPAKVIVRNNTDGTVHANHFTSAKKKYSLNNNVPKAKKSTVGKSTKVKTSEGPTKKTSKPKKKLQIAPQNGALNNLSHSIGDDNVIMNQNYTIVRSLPMSMSHLDGQTFTTTTAQNGYQTGYIIQQQELGPVDTIVLTNCDDGSVATTASILNNSKLYANPMEHANVGTVTGATVIQSSTDGLIVGQPQAAHSNAAAINSTAAGATSTADYVNIIDNCFFADDTLNVLHSPFSSDNDVDGFIIGNSNGGNASNKELLNKFHDRLEEMEEKIDNSEYKLYWNGETDEENDDEAMNGGDVDEDDVVGTAHGHEGTATEFAELIVPKQQFNEFV